MVALLFASSSRVQRRLLGCTLRSRCAFSALPRHVNTDRSICSANFATPTAANSLFQDSRICNFPQKQHTIHQIQIRHMAGHNKWSKIKRKKGANDVARANTHTKAARAIETASRACQGDMSDIHLQSTISAARAVQLPKERMEKAVERGANPNMKAEGVDYVLRRYDGMIPSGTSGKVAIIIEALTENKNRTAANVRNIVSTRAKGELLPTGANDWMFEHTGVVLVSKYMGDKTDGGVSNADQDASIEKVEVDMDELLECALEGGAMDVEFNEESENDGGDDDNETHDNFAMIKCEPNDMLRLVKSLKAGGYHTTQFENQWLLNDKDNTIELDTESAEHFDGILNRLDDDLDVTNVFHNAAFADDRI